MFMIGNLHALGNDELNQVASAATGSEQKNLVAPKLPIESVFAALNASRFEEGHYSFKIPFENVEFEIYGSPESKPFLTINVRTEGAIKYTPIGHPLNPIPESKVTDEHRSQVEALMKQLLQGIPDIIHKTRDLTARELAKEEN